jgi:serine protease AprX
MAQEAREERCPVCGRDVPSGELLSPPLPEAEAALVAANTPGWRPEGGLCRDCLDRFQAALEFVRRHPGIPRGGRAVLPITVRLGALDRYLGRGVTIAFLDSGFYAHPDLVEPKNRILKYVDVSRLRARAPDLRRPDESSWHGMMTSVVACGNGRLSNGLYRGLASEARIVLVKCGSVRRVVHDDIRRGLEWVIRNRGRYGIRIVNVSVGGDYEASYLHDGLSQAAEKATREGLLVCAAAGNAGNDPRHAVIPPASAPSVLTVGGVDDKNRLPFLEYGMYHSSYGPTIDGLQKPDVIAPSIWLAAPILPGTPEAAQASLLEELATAEDGELRSLIASHAGLDPFLSGGLGLPDVLLRQLVEVRLQQTSVLSSSYKHVDGTSFAAPIVTSIAAQMLEANPRLTPQELKLILVRTARRLPEVPPERQGFGVVDPRRAVLEALGTRRPRKKRTAEPYEASM